MLARLEEVKARGDVEKYTIKGFFLAKVVDVYDGDTCFTVFDVSKPLNKDFKFQIPDSVSSLNEFSIRMLGYDTEEIRQGLKVENRDELKKIAVNQKKILENYILDKIVLLEACGFDKYGRVLGKVFNIKIKDNQVEIIQDVNSEMLKISVEYNP